MKSLLLIILFNLVSLSLYANNDEINADMVAEGGRLYDKWWEELKLEKPESTHISYPASSKKQGGASWRCKECHGWDYKGVKGAYGKGSHFTGIKGISQAKNKRVDELVNILKNRTHNYNTIPDSALIKIAIFIKFGQVDISPFITKKTKRVHGDLKRGQKTFNNVCKKCHGADGRNINFRTAIKPEYIGTVAQENPWEAIHKIRYGQPNTKMPNMNKKLLLKAQIDLLSYIQSLPAK